MNHPHVTKFKHYEKLSEYPVQTCYQAGHLVTINAGWRSIRPVLHMEKCKNCLQCYLYCPDGVIQKTQEGLKIDYDFCKGCGICAKICRIHAIEMEAEYDE